MSDRFPFNPGQVRQETKPTANALGRWKVGPDVPWSGLEKDYVLFYHGLLFRPELFQFPAEDPVLEWQAVRLDVSSLLQLNAMRQLIVGLPYDSQDPYTTLSRTVFAVDKPHWDEVAGMLAGIFVLDHKNKVLWRTSIAQIVVLDPRQKDTTGLPGSQSYIRLVVIGLDSSIGRLEFQQPVSPYTTIPLVHRPVRIETVELAKKLFHGELEAVSKDNLTNPMLVPKPDVS